MLQNQIGNVDALNFTESINKYWIKPDYMHIQYMWDSWRNNLIYINIKTKILHDRSSGTEVNIHKEFINYFLSYSITNYITELLYSGIVRAVLPLFILI